MYTVENFLEYYKDEPFEKLPFCEADNLFFVCLSYIPFEKALKGRNATIEDAWCMMIDQQIEVVDDMFKMNSKTVDLLNKYSNCKRYKDVLMCNVESVLTSDTQFAAMTFRKGKMVAVAYRGTDASISGWKENLTSCFECPNETQRLATKYLNKTLKFFDKSVYVIGHSKGGNLAVAASMFASNFVKRKIEKIYNNDGPGFKKEILNSKEFKSIENKLITFVPEDSWVGMVLNYNDYHVIKSNAIGLYQHPVTVWELYGPFLVSGNQTAFSKKAHQTFNETMEKAEPTNFINAINILANVIEKAGVKYLWEIKLPEFIKIIKAGDDIDEDTRNLFIESVNNLFIK